MKKEDLTSLLLAGVLFLPASADAKYLDPGSGSLIIQMLVAGVAAVSYFFRHSIGNFFRKLRGGKDEDASNDSDE